MRHLGDITKINGAEIEPVDCITFGSPCQDLSVAGKRAGLAGERSGLFMEAVRIIKEMRKKTNGLYPTFAIWENVAGAFSSNGGEDFRAVLEELTHIRETFAVVSRPESGKWSKSGFVCGDDWSIAWRLLDAQYWGVPQRRKRIALVVDLGGQRAGEILFECEGLPGHPEPSIPAWKNSAASPKDRAGAGCIQQQCPEIGHALKAKANCQLRKDSKTDIAEVFCIQGDIARGAHMGQNGIGCTEDRSYTLNTIDNHAVAYCIDQQGGKGHANYSEDVSCTLMHDSHGTMYGVAYAIDGYNAQVTGDVAATMGVNCGITTGRNGVIEAYAIDCRNATINPEVNGTLQAKSSGGTSYNLQNVVMVPCAAVASCHTNAEITTGGVSPTLLSRMNKGVPYICGYEQQTAIAAVRWIVRRIMPIEAERLQGFPENWTLIGEWTDSKGKKHKEADTPRYKALGNSIALPQWWWLTQKMKPYLPEHAKLGSLFDGIGGFPLVWETGYGKGTARWASEIEEFPVAVTKYHFPEE